nr:MAG TPA: hypothetical protein [Caudoviricetes sp.]
MIKQCAGLIETYGQRSSILHEESNLAYSILPGS